MRFLSLRSGRSQEGYIEIYHIIADRHEVRKTVLLHVNLKKYILSLP